MALLESYRYRLQMRRFIIELFDKSVVEHLVREGQAEPIGSPASPEAEHHQQQPDISISLVEPN